MTAARTPWLPPLVDDYSATLSDCLDSVVADGLDEQARILATSVGSSVGTVYALGNGGSSSTAESFRSHLKAFLGDRHVARAFTGWTPHSIVEAVEQHGFTLSTANLLARERLSRDDVVVLISASGNSRNLVALIDECLRRNIPVLVCTGSPGGELAKRAASRLMVATGDQQLIEDATHAALHLLITATKGELDGQPVSRIEMGELADSIKQELAMDVAWLDDASDAIADAVVAAKPVYVAAPEGGTLAAVAEHVAHNLMWDMCHDLEAAPPDIRSGISVAHFTGMSNDSPVPGDAMVSLMKHARTDDLLLLFSHDHHSPGTERMITHSENVGVRLFGCFGPHAAREEITGSVMTGGSNTYMRTLRAQVTGHLLLRASRPKISRRVSNRVNLAEEERQARASVAPLLSRGRATAAGTRDGRRLSDG